MGAKYVTTQPSGFNAAPPSDDGSQTDANKIKWATIRDKIGVPFDNWADALDTALLAAFDYSAMEKVGSYTVTAADHMRTVEAAPASSTTIVISLADAATVGNGFITRIKNAGAGTVTLARTTIGDTIDGVAGNLTLVAGASLIVGVKAAANGYLILASYDVKIVGTYTPTWTGAGGDPTLNNGTISGMYVKNGEMVDVTINVVFGNTTVAGAGNYAWSLPYAAKTTLRQKGVAEIFDNGTGYLVGVVNAEAGSTVSIRTDSGDVGATAPISFTTGDKIDITIRYQVA